VNDDDLWNSILGNDSSGLSVTQFANNLGQGGAGTGSPPPNSGSILDSWKATGLGGDTLAMLLPQLDDASAAPLPAGAVYFGQSPPSLASTPTGNAPLSSLFSTGLGGDVIASVLPQRQDTSAALPPADTSAAFLSPSSLQPPSALYDPNPPAPTVDQLAQMLGMSPQDVAAIREQAKDQFRVQEAIGNGAVALTDTVVPEWGVLASGVAAGKKILSGRDLVTGAMDILNNQAGLTVPQREVAAGDQAIFQHLNDSLAQPYSSPNMPPAWRAFPW
jgi:hypothetical protein